MARLPAAAAAALFTFVPISSKADPVQSHADEISAFAFTMAAAKIVEANCRGLEVDYRFLEAFRQGMHVVEADYPIFRPLARSMADGLQRAVEEAPSPSDWCAAVFRLYGPDGKMMQGMLRRR